MAMYYAKRALEILREEGPVELSKRSIGFIGRYTRRPLLELQKIRLRVKYGGSAPSPLNIIYVNHEDIRFSETMKKTVREDLPSYYIDHSYGTFIYSGDWDDPTDRKIESYSLWQATEEHFEEDIPWEETCGFKKHPKGLWFFEPIEELYYNIESNGYKTQRELTDGLDKYFMPPEYDEIRVNIGRDGTLLFEDGRHRFFALKMLNYEQKIPVRVYVRHKKWQELRDKIHNNGLPEGREDLQDHPDLQDVLS